jgi:hypothetical protein
MAVEAVVEVRFRPIIITQAENGTSIVAFSHYLTQRGYELALASLPSLSLTHDAALESVLIRCLVD